MITLLTIMILACSIVAFGLFIFMMRFAVKTEVVVTTAMLTLLAAAGLFSWAILSAAEEPLPQWSDVAYICAILMFPLLIIMFVQRSTAQSFIITSLKGRIIVFGPLLGQLLTHFLLPDEFSRFTASTSQSTALFKQIKRKRIDFYLCTLFINI